MMTAQQWDKAKPIFEGACDLGRTERCAYLDQACAADPDLRRFLEQLLDSHDEANSFLQDRSTSVSVRAFPDNLLVAGRFRIARFLGRGGMGEVYEAYDERLRLRVALKTMRPELSRDPDSVLRFEREIRVAREVTHENLCRVYDLAEHVTPHSTLNCFTMEFIEGETLQQRLARGPMAPPDALPLIRQIGAALDALHRAGIVHRDLKPGNVMLVETAAGLRAVVTDFGLAKPLGGDRDPFESKFDVQAGAPYFMAPELFQGHRPTRESDIYSFGLVVDQIVTQSRAFPPPSPQAGRSAQAGRAQLVPPTDRCPLLPPHWNTTILRCLEADPARRYGSAAEVVRDLEAPTATPTPRRRALNWWVFAMAALSLVMAGAAALVGPPPPAANGSLVVFDIVNLSDQPTHLGRALVSELVTQLTHINDLRVVRYYEPRERANLTAVAERLHLDGDLQRHEQRVSLTLRLTDASDGRVVWSQQFEGDANNPLAFRKQIAGSVLRELESQLLREAVASAGVHYSGYRVFWSIRRWLASPQVQLASIDPAAYGDYMRGRQLYDERTVPASVQAIQSFHQAIRRAPHFAAAHAGLADVYMVQIELRYAPQDQLVKLARGAAARAVELDPQSADALTSLAAVHQLEWDWAGAEARYRQAIRIDPKHWRAHRAYGSLLIQFGRFDDALAEVRKGVELDPYDYPAQSTYGLFLFMAGRHAEALKRLREMLAKKDLLYAQNVLGSVYARHGQLASGAQRDEYFRLALAQASRVEAHERNVARPGAQQVATPMSDQMYATYYALMGKPQEARIYLGRLRSAFESGRGSATGMALVYGLLGEREEAARFLDTALAARERWLFHAKIHPFWEPLRHTSQFDRVIRTMRL